MKHLKFPRILHRPVPLLALVLVLCLIGCQTTTPLKLPAWQTFQKEMKGKYSSINHLRADQSSYSLVVSCYCGKISDEKKAKLKTDLKAFLSSEAFLTEYLAYADKNDLIREDAAGTLFYPQFHIHLAVNGSDKSEWQSEAGYFTGRGPDTGWTSNDNIDNYQTWSDLEH